MLMQDPRIPPGAHRLGLKMARTLLDFWDPAVKLLFLFIRKKRVVIYEVDSWTGFQYDKPHDRHLGNVQAPPTNPRGAYFTASPTRHSLGSSSSASSSAETTRPLTFWATSSLILSKKSLSLPTNVTVFLFFSHRGYDPTFTPCGSTF